MSYNLTPKRCPYCGRTYDPTGVGKYDPPNTTAFSFVPMSLVRPVFGKAEIIHVCRQAAGECVKASEADGYKLRPDLIPMR